MLHYSAWLSGRARGTQTPSLCVWRGGIRETQTQEVRNPSSGLALPWSYCVSRHRALSLLGPACVKEGPGWGLLQDTGFVITISEMTWEHALIRLKCWPHVCHDGTRLHLPWPSPARDLITPFKVQAVSKLISSPDPNRRNGGNGYLEHPLNPVPSKF